MLQHYAFKLVWVWVIATKSQDGLESQTVSAAIPFFAQLMSITPDFSLSNISSSIQEFFGNLSLFALTVVARQQAS